MTHKYASGYCNLAWFGLFLVLILVLTNRGMHPDKEAPRAPLLGHLEQRQISCTVVVHGTL